MRYPPHTAKKLNWARFFILRQVEVGKLARMALMAVLVIAAAVMVQVFKMSFFFKTRDDYGTVMKWVTFFFFFFPHVMQAYAV